MPITIKTTLRTTTLNNVEAFNEAEPPAELDGPACRRPS
jgi:hypothetical protein